MQNNTISWINHFIELIVVFIGITLAFMLNNWREDNRASELENQYISSFYEEITESGAKLDSMIIKNRQKCDRLLTAIIAIEKGTLDKDSTIIILSDMAQIALFIPKTNAYESIRNSGNFNIIKNYAVRSRIIAYYESFKGLHLIEEFYRGYINDYFIPYFFEKVDLINSKYIDGVILGDYRFNNIVAGYYQLLIQVVNTYENISKLNTELKQILESEYGNRLN